MGVTACRARRLIDERQPGLVLDTDAAGLGALMKMVAWPRDGSGLPLN